MQKLSIITYVTLIISVIVLSSLLLGNLLEKGGDFMHSLPTVNDIGPSNDTIADSEKDSISYVIDPPAADVAIDTSAVKDSTVSGILDSVPANNPVKDESQKH